MELEAGARSIVIIMAAAVIAPILVKHLEKWARIPSSAVELLLGVLIGPHLLAWVSQTHISVEMLSELGVMMLFLLAGYEINFSAIAGGPLKRASLGWVISLIVGLAVALTVERSVLSVVVVGLCLATTALGVVLPALRDSKALHTAFGTHVSAIGAVGEIAPVLAVAVFLSGERPIETTLRLLAFGAVALALAWISIKPRSALVGSLLSNTLDTSSQFTVRIGMFGAVAWAYFANSVGIDIVLGGLISGIALKLLLHQMKPHEISAVESKMEAIGYGFLIPIFFINTGIGLDVGALGENALAVASIPLILALFLIVRGVPTYFLERGGQTRRKRIAMGLFSATQLPLVIVISAIGVDAHAIASSTAAALVISAALSVLIFPAAALSFLRRA